MSKPDNPEITILTGDCRQLLKALPEKSVHCCVTSPPYWGLRDYGHPEQLGRESTLEEYVAALRSVFSEVRRVLRDDGTLWLNLGHSYAGDHHDRRSGNASTVRGASRQTADLKDKDLAGIPWQVAFALQKDGWYLRSDIIWHKPNAMPESVTDRPTKTHEYLFLLAKSKNYYYDVEAIKEPASSASARRLRHGISSEHKYVNGVDGQPTQSLFKPRLDSPDKQRGHSRRHAGFNERWSATAHSGECAGMRNRRTLWTVPTHPYRGAHFATYPPDLVRPCVLAGTSAKGCCPRCGAPWERITEKGGALDTWKRKCGANVAGGYVGRPTKDFAGAGVQDASALKARILAGMCEVRTVGDRCATAMRATLCPVRCSILLPAAAARERSRLNWGAGPSSLN